MQNQALFPRARTIGLVLTLLLASHGKLRAQASAETPAVKAASHDELSQSELLKSYLQVREQLHAAELSIANNRLESEATARAQAAAITEKLNLIESKIASESQRQQIEAQRSLDQQELQLAAAHETNLLVLRVSIGLGAIGLLTMLGSSLLQWRGIKHMEVVTNQLQQLPGLMQPGSSPTGNLAPVGDSVSHSNQRLMSVIDRMEQRIHELEHTAESPLVGAPGEVLIDGMPTRSGPASRIDTLLAKGRALLNANQAQEAIACYDELLAIDANHAEALVKKGSALERVKQDHAAIECYDRAIQADRHMALAYLSKGGIFNRLQRFDEAVECYEQALRVEKEGKQNGVARVSVSAEWPAANGNTQTT